MLSTRGENGHRPERDGVEMSKVLKGLLTDALQAFRTGDGHSQDPCKGFAKTEWGPQGSPDKGARQRDRGHCRLGGLELGGLDYLRRAALSASLAPAPGPESVPIQGSVPRQLEGERGEVYAVTSLHLEPNKSCIYSVLRTVFHAVIITFPRLHY